MRIITRLYIHLKKLNVHSALALAGMAGPVILVVTDLTAAFSTPGYSLVEHSISSLALSDIGWVQSIGFLAIGLLVEIFAAGLLFNIRDHRGFHLSIACLAIIGFGMLMLGAFRTDPVNTPDTTEGIIHNMVATGVFWLFPFTVLLMSRALKHDRNWEGLYKYAVVTAILAFILVIIVAILDDASSTWFGLAERILVANMILWVLVMGCRLLRISFTRVRS
jgi:hypothetical protein